MTAPSLWGLGMLAGVPLGLACSAQPQICFAVFIAGTLTSGQPSIAGPIEHLNKVIRPLILLTRKPLLLIVGYLWVRWLQEPWLTFRNH